MGNPYETLPEIAFWKTGVAGPGPERIAGLWQPKHRLRKRHKVATAGSCFAQHIGRALAARGYRWLDAEPAPALFDDEVKRSFGYGLFSFRTGNIYTAAALRQWIFWALGREPMSGEMWEKDGRVYDPFRPNIAPSGFVSADDLAASRRRTLAAVRQVIEEADVFVFTLGLTEGWTNRAGGYVYAMCPGTVAGTFDAAQHAFTNFGFKEILADLRAAFDAMRERNRKLRFLITVSPVPLTATASGMHVLTATTYSKSVLRAVAGQLAQRRKDTDYFPSYEIITAPVFGGRFYDANMRTVKPEGVKVVTASFFAAVEQKSAPAASAGATAARRSGPLPEAGDHVDDDVCEDALLEVFGTRK